MAVAVGNEPEPVVARGAARHGEDLAVDVEVPRGLLALPKEELLRREIRGDGQHRMAFYHAQRANPALDTWNTEQVILAAMADEEEQSGAQKEKQVKLPSAWGGVAEKNNGPKRWSADGRGDDPTVRIVHAPSKDGIGTGKAFFFLFGFKRASQRDQTMLKRELEQIDDDVETLRNAGYTVVVDPQATREDFIATVNGTGEGAAGLVPAGFYWSAHGNEDGSIECCDGGTVAPADVSADKLAAGLRLAIFGACYVGSRSRTWRNALGGKALVVGWGRPVTIDRAVDFLQPDPETTTDLDDLIQRWLLTDEPLPMDADEPASLPASASSLGRVGPLAERIKVVAEMLGARYREHGSHIDLEVPLPEGRSHFVQAFLIDASDPFCEGEILFGVEASVGEMTALVTPSMLLAGVGRAGYGRVALVKSDTDMPRIVSQAFVPLARATDQDLAAQIYQTAAKADALEHAIFGGDSG